MLEILLITIVVWIGLLSILFAINNSQKKSNNIIQNIIATQLAKEWVEKVYQTRNTNIIKNDDNPDLCRLNINTNEPCDWSNKRFSTWNYIITSENFVTWTQDTLTLSEWINTWDKTFALCLNEWQRISCPGGDNHTKYWKFFRIIKWIGLYDKDKNITGWNLLDCPTWNTFWCEENTPKEYKFCSLVYYIWEHIWKSEICSIMTNFFD